MLVKSRISMLASKWQEACIQLIFDILRAQRMIYFIEIFSSRRGQSWRGDGIAAMLLIFHVTGWHRILSWLSRRRRYQRRITWYGMLFRRFRLIQYLGLIRQKACREIGWATEYISDVTNILPFIIWRHRLDKTILGDAASGSDYSLTLMRSSLSANRRSRHRLTRRLSSPISWRPLLDTKLARLALISAAALRHGMLRRLRNNQICLGIICRASSFNQPDKRFFNLQCISRDRRRPARLFSHDSALIWRVTMMTIGMRAHYQLFAEPRCIRKYMLISSKIN